MAEPLAPETNAPLPRLMYGTAWKEERTEALVRDAIDTGFRAIDTANQRKHYFEEGAGDALRRAFDQGKVSRADLFLQTKFTFRRGQDHRLPYDENASFREQVRQSLSSSIAHLGVDAIDSLVLHGPAGPGYSTADEETWRAMEDLVAEGKVRLLGVSNVRAEQLAAFADHAKVPITFVQNRCFAAQGWDHDVREVCRERGIHYQGFSLLTANRHVWGHPEVRRVAEARAITPAQVLFAYAIGLGMIPLTGTSSPEHMMEARGAFRIALTPEESETVRRVSAASG